jgi:transposase InsO family protein
MGLRRLIVEIDTSTVNVTEFCAQHGISTWFFWDLRRRFAREGEAALVPRSRAPHRVANRTPTAVEDQVVAKRKELVETGLDAGPGSIRWHLAGLEGLPSESTIWRILVARGFVVPAPAKAPKTAGRSFCAERANDCWQLDDTGWFLADGTEVKVLNIVDDHSRLLVASVALATCTGEAALAAVADGAAVLGWPARFLSDNAGAFRHVLAEALAELGVGAGHSRPYHPQTNGKVERFHETLKHWLRAHQPAEDLAQLQTHLDLFRLIYNHQRPHRSLDRRTPAEVWAHAPKSGPADRALTGPAQVHHAVVTGGTFWIARRYRISVGATHNGQTVLTVVSGTACHVFAAGRLIRALTIDPTRVGQPIHPRRGRPRPQP